MLGVLGGVWEFGKFGLFWAIAFWEHAVHLGTYMIFQIFTLCGSFRAFMKLIKSGTVINAFKVMENIV